MLSQYQVLIMCFQYTNSLHIITLLIVSIALWDGEPLLPPLTGNRAESCVDVWSATPGLTESDNTLRQSAARAPIPQLCPLLMTSTLEVLSPF